MPKFNRYDGVERRSYEGSWHLDKKVSIGIILAICLQCACFIWYGAKLDSQVQQTKTDVKDLQVWKAQQDDEKAKIEAHLSGIDQNLINVNQTMTHIQDILEKQYMRR